MKRRWEALGAERVALRYLDALEAEDDQSLAELWRAACEDPALCTLLLELDEGLSTEEEQGEAQVQRLVQEHLGAHLLPAVEELTSAVVVSRLKDLGGSGPMSSDDQLASLTLLSLRAPLPADLGQRAFDAWVKALPLKASRGYWRAFRKTAVLLALGQADAGIELAAARSAEPGRESRGGSAVDGPPSDLRPGPRRGGRP